MNEVWVLGIVTFLFVLSVKKYNCIDTLREWIEDYLAQISPKEVIEQDSSVQDSSQDTSAVEDDILVLEELRDMVEDFVIRNPEIFSNLNNKKDG